MNYTSNGKRCVNLPRYIITIFTFTHYQYDKNFGKCNNSIKFFYQCPSPSLHKRFFFPVKESLHSVMYHCNF